MGDSFLVSVMAWILLLEMTVEAGAEKSALAERLAYYGGGVQRYIGISAGTGIITAKSALEHSE